MIRWLSDLAYRVYVDTSMGALVCKVRGKHNAQPSSYRDESCVRCDYIGPRSMP